MIVEASSGRGLPSSQSEGRKGHFSNASSFCFTHNKAEPCTSYEILSDKGNPHISFNLGVVHPVCMSQREYDRKVGFSEC